jgi:hypothetical protein
MSVIVEYYSLKRKRFLNWSIGSAGAKHRFVHSGLKGLSLAVIWGLHVYCEL